MKKNLFIFLVLFGFLNSCTKDAKETSDLLGFIPPKTAAILKTENLSKFAQELNQNALVNANTDLPVIDFFKSSYHPIDQLKLSKESLWTFSVIGRDEIATTLITPTISKPLDSLDLKKVNSFDYNGVEVKEYKVEEKSIYGAKVEGILAFGDSKLVIENIIRLAKDKFTPDPKLERIFKSSSNKRVSTFINIEEFEKLNAIIFPNNPPVYLNNFSDWAAVDIELKNDRFHLSGVSIPEQKNVLGIFNNLKPQKNEIAQITPSGATGFYSFSFDDFAQLSENISFYRKEEYPKINTALLSSTPEIGTIYIGDTKAVVLKSIDAEETAHFLQGEGELIKTHRESDIYSFKDPNYFYEALNPLIKITDLGFYTQIDSFFIFAQNKNTLENIISNYRNKTVLAESESYKKIAKRFDEKSSILIAGNTKNILKDISNRVSSQHKSSYEKADLLSFNMSALQFISHDNFNYIHGEISASKPGEAIVGGIQTQSFKPEEEITNGPWFFENWRTKDYDVILQGESNTLYAYNENGKLRWKKQLDGPILGDIKPIDIYQNKRIQMAFTTPQTFYIIDREGNVVKPFNKTFKNTITQPLAVFDYNKNGTFRFIITQGNKLTMLDKNLKTVKGFEFTSAKSAILQTPKHFRVGNKDYIIIPEEAGKLHILNPRGQTRVKVNRNIDFSDNEWYLYNDLFVSTDKQGQLIKIDRNGGISIDKLSLDEHNKIDATAKTLVTFSENQLSIKGKTTKLDYGLYSKPKIFYLQDKLYISITDMQEHKVYLFDSSSKLLSGFPVYGNSAIDLQFFPNQGVKLIVKGEKDSALIYDVK